MIFEGALGEAEEIIYVRPCVIESMEQLAHLLLKDVWRVAEPHGRSLVFKFPEG